LMLRGENCLSYMQVDNLHADTRRFDVVAYNSKTFLAVCNAVYLPSHYCTGELLAAEQAQLKIVLLCGQDFVFPPAGIADQLLAAWGQRRRDELQRQGLRLHNLNTLVAGLDKKDVVSMGKGLDGFMETGIEIMKVCAGKTVTSEHRREGTLLLICDLTYDAAFCGAAVLAVELGTWLETKVGIPDGAVSAVFEAAKAILFLMSGSMYETAWFAEALLEARSKQDLKRFFVLTDLGCVSPSAAFVSRIEAGKIFDSNVFDVGAIAAAYQDMFNEIPLTFSTNSSASVQRVELTHLVNKLRFVAGQPHKNLDVKPSGTLRIRKIGSIDWSSEKESSKELNEQQAAPENEEGVLLV